MKKQSSSALKTFGFTWSSRAVVRWFLLIYLIYILLMFPLSLLDRFPQPFVGPLIIALYALPIPLILLLVLLSFAFIVHLESNQITLRLFGLPVRSLKLSEISLICAVGNERDNVICFTSRPIEEMAEIMEKRLQKSWLMRHDAYFRRKKPDWQDSFARDYLLNLMNSWLCPFRSREVIITHLDPLLAHRLRNLYPDLPYRNYTGVPVQPASYHYRANQAYQHNLYAGYNIKLSENGILLFTAKKDVFLLPAEDIRTVVRADLFINRDRHRACYTPLLVATRLTESELAERAPKRFIEAYSSAPDATSLLATAYCLLQSHRWSAKKHEFTPIICTQKNIDSLRSLYPQAGWIDLSDSWLIDRNPSA